MNDVIQRLRASKIEAGPEDQKHGYDFGVRWARDDADYATLRRLANVDSDYFARCETEYETQEDWSVGVDLFEKLFPPDDDSRTDARDVRDYWMDEVGLSDLQYNNVQTMMGFIEGAQSVWAEVESEL